MAIEDTPVYRLCKEKLEEEEFNVVLEKLDKILLDNHANVHPDGRDIDRFCTWEMTDDGHDYWAAMNRKVGGIRL